MKKLIKLSTDNFIIIDDSIIKVGDHIHQPNHSQVRIFGLNDEENRHLWTNGVNGDCFKITHSTEPLEGVEKLYLKEVKELINEFDIQDYSNCFVKGENHAFELGYYLSLGHDREKKYTAKDMINFACDVFDGNFSNDASFRENAERMIEEFVVEETTEWGVEFDENGKLFLEC